MLGLVDRTGGHENEHGEIGHRNDDLLVPAEETAVGAQPREQMVGAQQP